MRARHTAHSLPSFPVYTSAFVDEHLLVLGGGGGPSKTGIKNKLRLYNVDETMKLTLADELELEKGEDAPMSMAAHPESKTLVCGINSSLDKIQSGQNENCRMFGVTAMNKLALIGTQSTLNSGDVDDYQKVTVLSPNGILALVAGKQTFSLIAYPSLVPISRPISFEKDAIYDASFTVTTLIMSTTNKLRVYSLPESINSYALTSPQNNKKGKQKARPLEDLQLLKVLDPPAHVGKHGCTFRAARFHPQNKTVLYTALNAVSLPSRGRKSNPPKAYLCIWDTETWSVVKVRKIGDRALTCLDVSPDGNLLGYGLSDCSIGIVDGSTLTPLVTILKAHDFPPTTIRFNPSGTILVSASADNTLRTVVVPTHTTGQSSGILTSLLVILIAVILAFATQYLILPVLALEP